MSGLQLFVRQRGSAKRIYERGEKAGAQAVTSGIRRRTNALKDNMRRRVRAAGLGPRLANTIRGVVYPPRGESMGAKGVVFDVSAVGKKRNTGRFVDLIRVFMEGATIRPHGKRFLAIPTDAVGFTGRGLRGGDVRKQPSDYPKGKLLFVPGKNGRTARLVFADRPDVTAFVLVPNARIRPRLDFQRDIAKAVDGLDELIVRDWERRLSRIEASA